MMEPSAVGYGAAFLAGLLSFLSPCVLPLIPVYLSLITGVSVEALRSGERSAFWATMSRTLLFVCGFSLVFTLMGATASGIGQFLRAWADVVRIVGGLLVIVFGLHFTGLVPIALLYREKRFSLATGRFGAIGTFLMGMTFAIGWQACIGPMLGSILLVAATEGHVAYGISLLLTYSAGLGLPFLLAAAAFGTFLKLSDRVKRVMHAIEVGSGVLLILLGLLLLTNQFSLLSRWAGSLWYGAK
jgi:cytochrome c-type biogenesis protein